MYVYIYTCIYKHVNKDNFKSIPENINSHICIYKFHSNHILIYIYIYILS